jgi:hypothetical protein
MPWVTLDDDQHVYISDSGKVLATHDAISRTTRAIEHAKAAGPARELVDRSKAVIGKALQNARNVPPVKFAPHPSAQGKGYKTVHVNVRKVNADLALDSGKFGKYVGPGGTGAAIEGRYAEFSRFLAKAKREGTAIEQPRAYLAVDTKKISIGDGRHRFAVLRDQGATTIPVSVRRSEAAEIERRYGATVEKTLAKKARKKTS